jgi:acyl-CoA dehydrogenase
VELLPPDAETGEGLSNLDYAYIAQELGKNPLASECLNCSAPDTGNMEVLERVGTPEQKKQWLEPLLHGEIRSAYVMTEPDVASSDAKNIRCRAVRDGDEYVINGEKYYASGRRRPALQDLHRHGADRPDAPPHKRQSQILVPQARPASRSSADARVRRGRRPARPHAPALQGLPRPCVQHPPRRRSRLRDLAGPPRTRPDPPLHALHRRREKALELMVRRGLNREAFGKPIAKLGKNTEVIAKARIEIEAMRLMVLRAAKAMDVMGNAEARVWVSAVKAMVPERVCHIIDEAIQIHGATGVSQWTPLARMYASQRTLRIADGPTRCTGWWSGAPS